ncbi:YdiY family protein [Marinicella sp. W31]|uniref:DUF481 domain-containing protein n=1 Tax=Marinicella sp. W31 TaxID=3023713 RepID=UPI0037570A17
MMKNTVLVSSLMLALSGQALAQEEDKIWSGSGQLGFTMTSGNSDTETLNAGLNIKRETEKWLSEGSLQLLRATDDDETTAERYTLSTKTGYKWDDNDYVYYSTRYDNDNFSGFDYTMTTGIGWGHKFYDEEKKKLITEIGVGYKTEALDIDRSENNGAALLGKLDYMRQITDTVKFEDVLIVEATDDNTFIQNDAGFSFKVTDATAVKLAYQIRHNTDVPMGVDKTDSLFSANFVYDF